MADERHRIVVKTTPYDHWQTVECYDCEYDKDYGTGIVVLNDAIAEHDEYVRNING